MRYRGARVIAIDDQQSDLQGIVKALHRTGVGVLPFHYTGSTSLRKCFPGVRIVFSDISVLASGGQPHQQHAAVAAILDQLLEPDNGPWILVAWTSSPDQVGELHQTLANTLGAGRAPLASLALAKSEFLTPNGNFRIGEIAKAIEERVTADPTVGAIFDLEIRASEAARDITRSIVELGSGGEHPTVADVLKALSKAADASADASPELVFQTIAPAFQDRLVKKRISKSERRMWDAAFGKSQNHNLSTAQSAFLNTSLHLDPNAKVSDRGSLSSVPQASHKLLRRATGIELSELVFRHFLERPKMISSLKRIHKDTNPPNTPTPSDTVLTESFLNVVSWWLIEAVPSCDVSNNKRGLRRSLVGLGVPVSMGGQTKAGDHVIKLPTLQIGGSELDLFISAKVTLSPPQGRLAKLKPLGRLRDPVLDCVLQHVAGSQSRLGWTSF
jgi:hypothetical protein